MGSETFARQLVYLASTSLQERFGVRATRDSYVLLDDVLERASDCVRMVTSNHPMAAKLPAEVRAAILALEPRLSDDKFSRLSWIEATVDPDWKALREQAASVFAAMGISLAEWEQRELRSHDA